MRAAVKGRISWLAWLLAGAVVAVFTGANVHLVYVAVTSQPDCVTHLKEAQEGTGQYRAARSDC